LIHAAAGDSRSTTSAPTPADPSATEEADPLDAFMAEINAISQPVPVAAAPLANQARKAGRGGALGTGDRPMRVDEDDADDGISAYMATLSDAKRKKIESLDVKDLAANGSYSIPIGATCLLHFCVLEGVDRLFDFVRALVVCFDAANVF